MRGIKQILRDRHERRKGQEVITNGLTQYWDDYKAEHFAPRSELERDEDEAYARNYAMNQREARLAELTTGPGPGYEEVPGWIRVRPEKAEPCPPEYLSAIDEGNQKYWDWLDLEWGGDEKGNPPDCPERDGVIENAAEVYPEQKAEATPVSREPNGQWTFEGWAYAHGYTSGDIEITHNVEDHRQETKAQREPASLGDREAGQLWVSGEI